MINVAVLLWVLASTAGMQNLYAGSGFLQAPIEGEWIPGELRSHCGEEVSAELALIPASNISSIEIRVQLEEGVTLRSGKLLESISDLKAGETIRVPFKFAVEVAHETRIVASVALVDTADIKISKAFVLFINRANNPVPNGVIKKDSEGNKIIVY
jgi:hypothetical protein